MLYEMTKIILILNMLESKSSFFVNRLVVFNETFVLLNSNSLRYCVVWNEAMPDIRQKT